MFRIFYFQEPAIREPGCCDSSVFRAEMGRNGKTVVRDPAST